MDDYAVTGIAINDGCLEVNYEGRYRLTFISAPGRGDLDQLLMLVLMCQGARVAICDLTAVTPELAEPADDRHTLRDVGEFWQTAYGYIEGRIIDRSSTSPEHDAFLRRAWHIVSLESSTALPQLLRGVGRPLPQPHRPSSIGSYRGH